MNKLPSFDDLQKALYYFENFQVPFCKEMFVYPEELKEEIEKNFKGEEEMQNIDDAKIGINIRTINKLARIDLFYPMNDKGFWENGDDSFTVFFMRDMSKVSYSELINLLNHAKNKLIQDIKGIPQDISNEVS